MVYTPSGGAGSPLAWTALVSALHNDSEVTQAEWALKDVSISTANDLRTVLDVMAGLGAGRRAALSMQGGSISGIKGLVHRAYPFFTGGQFAFSLDGTAIKENKIIALLAVGWLDGSACMHSHIMCTYAQRAACSASGSLPLFGAGTPSPLLLLLRLLGLCGHKRAAANHCMPQLLPRAQRLAPGLLADPCSCSLPRRSLAPRTTLALS